MVILAVDAASDATVQIVALVVGLVQTIALAVIADRSRRVRSYDRRSGRNTTPAGPQGKGPAGVVPEQRS